MRFILPIALAFAIGLSAPALAQNTAPPPPAATDAPKAETPNAETPKSETPSADAPNAAAPNADAPKPEVTKNGDWYVVCQQVTVDGEPTKACEMQQLLEDAQSGQALIRISVLFPRTSKKPVLNILTPLGVLLQKGLTLQIDQGKPIVLPFAICVAKPPACVIDGMIDDNLITALKRGNGGTLNLSFGNNKSINANFSLNGFTKSFAAIAPK